MSDLYSIFSRDPLMPFDKEIVLISSGALTYAIHPLATMIFVGLLMFGGLFGSIAYNRQLKSEGEG